MPAPWSRTTSLAVLAVTSRLTPPRLRECADLIGDDSASQHVRSLDLGILTKRVVRERDWDDYLIVLEVFARRRTSITLWPSEVRFCFSGRRE